MLWQTTGGLGAPWSAPSLLAWKSVWLLAFVPSIDMHMSVHGQTVPSSTLWYSAVQASTVLKCKYALLAAQRDAQIQGQDSLAQLETCIKQHLPHAMCPTGGEPLPTSLCLIVHGLPGTVVLGGQEVGVLRLLEMIVAWLESEQRGLSAFLQHVHFDSCKALLGVQTADKQRHATIKHIALSGFTVNSGVQAAQVLGQSFLAALSGTIQGSASWDDHGLTLKTLEQAKQKLSYAIGRPDTRQRQEAASRGGDATVDEQCLLLQGMAVV